MGGADIVTLNQARERALDYRRMAKQGLNPRYEENELVSGGIGIEKGPHHSPNDAVIYRWQAHAGRFSEKTLDKHLIAIRQFEALRGFKAFEKRTLKDAHEMRDHLKASLSPEAVDPTQYGTHLMRRTKANQLYKKTGNMRHNQLLFGHTRMEGTARYLGVELEDTLTIAERVEI